MSRRLIVIYVNCYYAFLLQQKSIELDPDSNLGSLRRNLCDTHGLDGSILQVVCQRHMESASLNQGLGFIDICTLQTNHDRLRETDFLGSIDDSSRNHVTSHDTSENVDQDCLDARVRVENFKGFLNLGCVSTSANVQKVCWAATL